MKRGKRRQVKGQLGNFRMPLVPLKLFSARLLVEACPVGMHPMIKTQRIRMGGSYAN
jgi:hypothetical protein